MSFAEEDARKTQRLLAVGGPLHGRVIQTDASTTTMRIVVSESASKVPVISGDAVAGAVMVFDRITVYDRVRINGLLVWHCGGGAKQSEGVVDALAILTGLERG